MKEIQINLVYFDELVALYINGRLRYQSRTFDAVTSFQILAKETNGEPFKINAVFWESASEEAEDDLKIKGRAPDLLIDLKADRDAYCIFPQVSW